MIVIAPADLSRSIIRALDLDVVAFRSLDELDSWRQTQLARAESLFQFVVAALDELDLAFATLPPALRRALEAISLHSAIPPTRTLEAQFPSRRSFYRMWATAIAEPPSRFLQRVRRLHAQRLLAGGFTAKAAAEAAGFSSADQMRKQMGRRGGRG